MRNEVFWSWYDKMAAPKLKGRSETFRKMFEHLDGFDRPVYIVETGCMEAADNWAGNGCSTVLFDQYAMTHKGSAVLSAEIVPEKIAAAKEHTSTLVEFACGDSVRVLHGMANQGRVVDLLYLDASHLEWSDPVATAIHHANELMAAMPVLRPESMVAIDDSPATMDDFPHIQVGGKGEIVARYAFSVGADLAFLEYQAGWTGITRRPDRSPDTVEDLVMRARAHVEGDRLTAACPLYSLILLLTMPPWAPRTRAARGEACAFFARLALSKRRVGVAMDWYHEALRADPAAVEYRLGLARRCYFKVRLLDAAVIEAQRATEIEPENVEAWLALGGFEHERRRLAEAAAAYDRAIEVSEPGSGDAFIDRATIALDMVDYGMVRDLCLKAMGTAREADAIHVQAMVAHREGRHEESIEMFDRAIAAGCRDIPVAHWHKSHPMESIGRWPEAWEERAWRGESTTRPELALPMKRFDAPLWTREAPAGSRVYVHAEAGAGDNICMARYLPLMKRMGFDVRYEATADLADLVRGSMPEIEVVKRSPFYPDALGTKPLDCHIPIGDLQRAFGTAVKTVPWEGPYLRADPAKVAYYRAATTGGSYWIDRKKIGLCWSSGIRMNDSAWLTEYGRRKSIHFDALDHLIARHSENAWVSLQVGPEREQMRGSMVDLLPEHPTWADTAALIECLDLVITVDTGVAHLAGAMGKPVWVMMHTEGSWHWMAPRPNASWNERSPWYPTARLYRQERPHEWGDVVARIAADLGRKASLVA